MNLQASREFLAGRGGSRRTIAWLGALFLAAIAAQAAYEVVAAYRTRVADTGRELDAQARVIAEQTARGIQAIDVVLRNLVDQLQSGPLAATGPDALHRYLREQAQGLVQADGLVVIHPDGSVRAVSQAPSSRLPPLDLAADPPFVQLRDEHERGLRIHNTMVSPGTQRRVFPIARRLVGPHGEFAGLVGAPGRVEYFQQFYRETYPDPSTRISLLHRNGWLLARHPPNDAALGQRVAILDTLLPPHAAAPATVRRLPSPIDGADHFVAVRLVPDYPLVVAVSREASAALAPWRTQAIGTAWRTLALGALAALLLVVVLRQLRRLDAARASLEISQARYALAAAGSDDGIWDWDLVGGTAYESRRARELQGLPLEPETQPLHELRSSLSVHPDDAERRSQAMQAHLEGRTPAYEVEYRVRHAGGVERWIRVRALCVRDALGRAQRIAGSVSDVDARKRAELALRQSEQRFAVAVAGAEAGIWEWDYTTGQAFGSRRGREILGMPPGPELRSLGDWMAEMEAQMHPADVARRQAAIADHLAGRTPAYAVDFRVRHADGRYRWVHVHGMCVRDGAGRPLRMAGSASDIDDRKRAEEALRESEERYALAMTGSRSGHWVWDAASDRLFVSAKLNELFGLPPDTHPVSRTQYLAQLPFHRDDRDRVLRLIEQQLRGGHSRAEYETRIVLPDGSVRWILTRAQRFDDPEGRSTRIAGVSVDISERKQAEAERERLEQQLRQAQKLEAIGTLAGGIAHDFNNILSAILGYGELVQRDAGAGSALRRHIDAAMSAAQRAKSLVERILAFSRSGLGERVPVHVQAVLEEALEAVAPSLPAGVQLVRRLEAGDAAVFGDPTQLHQVVLNLCANAAQALRHEGVIEVTAGLVELDAATPVATSTLAPGPYVRIAVRDDGAGIAPQLLERIFDPFFTTKDVGVGTGLGLSLVHGIVTDLGGGIEVYSRLGVGSTFTVWLPRQVYVPAPAAVVLPAARGNGETVLLVDDEEALVRLGEEMLAELGYEPVGFSAGAAALEALRDEPRRFDLVLTDEAMPELTGCELVAELRRLRPDIPIVLMSGFVSPALVRRARELGVNEVLGKPLESRDIARALASALQHGLPAGAM